MKRAGRLLYRLHPSFQSVYYSAQASSSQNLSSGAPSKAFKAVAVAAGTVLGLGAWFGYQNSDQNANALCEVDINSVDTENAKAALDEQLLALRSWLREHGSSVDGIDIKPDDQVCPRGTSMLPSIFADLKSSTCANRSLSN